MKLKDKTDQCRDYYAKLQDYATQTSVWSDEITDLCKAFDGDFTQWDQDLVYLQQADRIAKIFIAGLENNQTFKDALTDITAPLWTDFTNPPVSEDLQDSVAQKLYFQTIEPDAKGRITIAEGARYIGVQLLAYAERDAVPFYVQIMDSNFTTLLINHTDDDKIAALADYTAASLVGVTKRIAANSGTSVHKTVKADKEKHRLYREHLAKRVSGTGTLDFCLTSIPSRKDAEIDGIDYDDYIKLYFEMCDQPWDHIGRAHEKLIGILNATTQLRFRNNDGTDLTMELIDYDGTHFTFCNSLVARNVPGSEVFSAPRRDSVNGTIVAKGRFAKGGGTIENLTMHFKDGKLTAFTADKGAEYFQDYIDSTEQTRYVGEIGIGTNPHLKRHVINTLLVEKIGGSFHVALGGCYQMTEYCGAPVHVDNGNIDNAHHWDITTLLYGKDGTIETDGEIIMKDGRFTDPELAVLNEGWAAVPVADRPAYWKDFEGYAHNT